MKMKYLRRAHGVIKLNKILNKKIRKNMEINSLEDFVAKRWN